ncbi:hypothetical protein [Mycobacterium shimoidei]|uniref:Uncharacterized protein n=1 Tax=Mycobacterium shimoidei TaxID=29313 RepID=A0A1E3TEG1_MYCSH|nr:hypothetical protein [Mycobacterium shimoidei]ODR12770.1 hypothetical protein BHQ16_13915 [Mycobacterium shimoidei]ORW83481.1 hypothetical protein AWC26_01760 [Mycobacterium shimoidei]SRX95686.1 hypothetical protein MSP7336_03955 [Mycobacterium shimoidei]
MVTAFRHWCTATAAVAVVVGGCSSPQQPESTPEVTLVEVGAALHSPIWSYGDHTLLALTDDRRLAKISGAESSAAVHTAQTALSTPLDAGRNLQISQMDDRYVYVPEPRRNRVAVVDIASLQSVGDFDAGPAPDYLSEDAGMRILLALSADGSSVTPVEEHGYRKLATADITGGRADSIDGSNRGRLIDYHVYGPSGIRYYKGPSSPPEERGALAMDVAASAGNSTKVTRIYVADHRHGLLSAIDSRREGQGMELVGQAQVSSSPIRYIGTDDTRIYAVTDHELVTLEIASFAGYPNYKMNVIHTVDYRSNLPAGQAKSAALSGIAVGPHRVFLTLRGTNYVVGVAKPHL